MSSAIDHELLLRQTGWLRVLALELVGDADRAEDVLQETWLAAVRHPPEVEGDERRLRAWLGAVARNLSKLSRRRDANRTAREIRSARPERQPSVEESLQRAALQQTLMESVMALEPSQREVVVLRYFDELPPREIAARLGISGTAVRSRLARALAVLRRRLDLDQGDDRRAWSSAFGPPAFSGALEAPGATARAIPFGGLLVKTQTQLLVIAVALTAVGSVVWWTAQRPSVAARADDAAVTVVLPPAEEPPLEEVRSVAPSVAGRREAEGGKRRMETPAVVTPLAGRVTDTAARPVSGVAVQLQDSGERAEGLAVLAAPCRATTDSAGRFEMPFPPGRGRLVVDSDVWVTLLDVPLGADPPEREPTLIVATRCSYSGVVLDEDGNPLDQVTVRAVMDRGLLRGLRPGVQRTEFEPSWRARTDEAGAFALSDVGWSEGLRLQVTLGGYADVSQPLPHGSDPDLSVVMRRLQSGPLDLSGVVVDPAGEPVADALVFAGESVTRSDRQGSFVLDRTGSEAGETLRAVKQGFLPAELDLAEDPASPAAARSPVVLRLGGAPLSIRGRVTDPGGSPLAGVYVWTHDGLRMPRSDVNPHRQVEDALGFGDGLSSNRLRATANDGGFELTGLLPRAYRVWAAHPATLEIIDAGLVEAGSPEIVLAFAGSGARRVAGRVTSFSGDPLPGIRLFFGCHGSRGGATLFTPLMTDLAPQSDEQGYFEFAGLFTEGAYLLPAGPEIAMADRLYLDEVADLENIAVRLPRPCLFQILLEQDPDEADRLRILDAKGNVLNLMVETQTLTLATNGGMGLEGGRSDVITTDERAHTLVLLKAGEEVRRVPLKLAPGEVQILRY